MLYAGSFFGYRALAPLPAAAGGRVQLPILELMGKIPTRNTTYDGNALDAYPAITVFPNRNQSEAIWVQTWDEALTFRLSADGVTYQDEVEVDPDENLGSWFRRVAARGFAVKNETAGDVARYQIVAFFV